MMKRIRKPAVAGSFYPSDPGVLRTTVVTLLAEARGWHGAAPLALVAPHAGYVYSGPVAASAYACLKPFRERYRRVVLLGPAHRAAVRGIALPDVDAFASPLGDVALDRETMDALDDPDVMVDDAAHRLEHSLEVQLPFLQVMLNRFRLVPLLIGAAAPVTVARVIERLWTSPDTLIVVSTDLSHYLPHAEARQRDRATRQAIEELAGETLTGQDACGAAPLRGLLLAAERRGLAVRTLDLRNSGDTAGDRAQVVGYGAWIFTREDTCVDAA
jgi:AmmeMemoRadiSam system protein B